MELHKKIRQKGKRVPKKLEKKSIRSKTMDFLSRVRRCILYPIAAIGFVTIVSCRAEETPDRRLVSCALAEIGVREDPLGSNRGGRIDEYNKAGQADLGSPYCASFTVWCFKKIGQTNYGNAYCPSWYKKEKEVQEPRMGDQVLVYFQSMGRFAHIGCCVIAVRYRGSHAIETDEVEANTNIDGSREGIGVFKRTRRCDSVTYVRWLTPN